MFLGASKSPPFSPPENGLAPDSLAFLRKKIDKMQVQLDSEEVPSSQDAWEVPIDAFRGFFVASERNDDAV